MSTFSDPDNLKNLYQSLYLNEAWEGSKEDKEEDKKLAKKHKMSLKDWEKSAADKKHDMKEMREDIYDIVLEYLCVEGYAETLEDAEWIMVNQLTSEDIEEILEAQKPLPTQKMQNRRFYVNMKTGEAAGSSRNQKIDSVLQAHKKDPEGEAAKARAKSKYRG